jgi:outer membrane protein assembly factor BamA
MPDMRCRLAQPVLAIACVLSCQPPTHAQVLLPAANPDAQNIQVCAPSSVDKRPSGPEVAITQLNFEGDLRMPTTDQDQIATDLKQRTYSGEPDAVVSEVLERVRRAWEDRGYFKVQAHGDASVLTSSPTSERIAVTVQVDEGQQYRLEDIRFNNNRAISNVDALRSLFPLKDGDIFSREEVAKGLDNLRFAYRQLGYINFTSIPNTQFNDERQAISLGIDIDEGKQFYVSSVGILGRDDHVLKDSLLKRGNVYDQRLVDLFLQEHASSLPTDASPDSRIHLRLNERAGTVAVTFDFRPCPLQEQP